MSFLGMGILGWTALTAIGTLALAGATTAAIIVTARIARTDRARDDRRRLEDAAEWARRFSAEQRDREDYEARQITVEVEPVRPLSQAEATARGPASGREPTHHITISTPAAYPIKWVDAMIAYGGSGNLGLTGTGWGMEKPVTENGRLCFRCWAEITGRMERAEVITRFVSRQDVQYYAYLNHVQRFPQNTDWHEAASEIDKWIRTGPKPDDSGS
jgi:hypothetical protein